MAWNDLEKEQYMLPSVEVSTDHTRMIHDNQS